MRVELDGVILPSEQYYVEDIAITETFDNSKANSREFTFFNNFEGTEGAYSIMNEKFLLNENGRLERVSLKIFDDCCGSETLVFDGIIQGKDIEFCDYDCSITATAYENRPFYDCIKTVIMADVLPDLGHPLVPVAKDFNTFETLFAQFMQGAVIGLAPILAGLQIVEAVVNFIRKFGFGKKNKIDIPSLDNLQDYIESFDDIYWYASPFVRDYVQGVCDYCGEKENETYTFQSSILNDESSDYYRTVLFSAKYRRGVKNKEGAGLQQDNKILQIGTDFLDEIVRTFNGFWRVVDKSIVIEQKDYFNETGDYFDLSGEKTCYSFIDADLPAHGVIKWTDDTFDTAGNAEIANFDGVFDWNTPENKNQRGRAEFLIPFGRHKIDDFKGLFGGKDLGKVLKMANTTAGSSKLLILDQNNQLFINDRFKAQTLYDRFFYTENPRSNSKQGFDWELEIEMNCTTLAITKGSRVLISRGYSYVLVAEKNYTKRTIKLNGTI